MSEIKFMCRLSRLSVFTINAPIWNIILAFEVLHVTNSAVLFIKNLLIYSWTSNVFDGAAAIW